MSISKQPDPDYYQSLSRTRMYINLQTRIQRILSIYEPSPDAYQSQSRIRIHINLRAGPGFISISEPDPDVYKSQNPDPESYQSPNRMHISIAEPGPDLYHSQSRIRIYINLKARIQIEIYVFHYLISSSFFVMSRASIVFGYRCTIQIYHTYY